METLKTAAIFSALAGATNQVLELFDLTNKIQKLFLDWFGIRWGSDFPTALLVSMEVFLLTTGLILLGQYNLVPNIPEMFAVGPVPSGVIFSALVGLLHWIQAEYYWWDIQGVVGKNLTGFFITATSAFVVSYISSFLI